jgi:Glycosyltransferase family 87
MSHTSHKPPQKSPLYRAPGKRDRHIRALPILGTIRRLSSASKEGLWTTFALGAVCFFLLTAAYVALQRGGALNETVLRKTDFVQFYAAGRLIMQGHAGQIYKPQDLALLEMSIQHVHAATPTVLPYLDLPFFALLLAPLSRFPYLHAYTAWLAVDCLLLACSLVLLALYSRLPLASFPMLGVAALLFPPVTISLLQGQVSILLLGLTAATLVAASTGQDRVAGATLAIAMLKPPFVAPLLLVFLLRRRWQSVGTFALTLLIELALPLLVFGASATGTYLRLLVNVWRWQGLPGPVIYRHVQIATATYSARLSNSMASVVGLLSPSGVKSAAVAAFTIALLLALAWCTLHARSIDAPMGLAVLTSILISPHLLVHDLCLILVPMAVIRRYGATRQTHVSIVLGTMYCLFFVGFLFSFALPFQLSLVATVTLLVWLAGALFMDGRRSCPVPPI